jgi:hypothetical protein
MTQRQIAAVAFLAECHHQRLLEDFPAQAGTSDLDTLTQEAA